MAFVCARKTGETFVFGPLAPRIRQGEVLPVPPEMLPKAWPRAQKFFRSIPDYKIERLHRRLLLGEGRLWLAFQTAGVIPGQPIVGVIVTSVSDKPPSVRKCFQKADPAAMRSLTVHLAAGEALEAWISSAIERITAYGIEQGCRQLFLLARKGWLEYARRFYSKGGWDTVAYSRDRPTQAKGEFPSRNRVGYYRPLVPVRKWTRGLYNRGSVCYIQEGAA